MINLLTLLNRQSGEPLAKWPVADSVISTGGRNLIVLKTEISRYRSKWQHKLSRLSEIRVGHSVWFCHFAKDSGIRPKSYIVVATRYAKTVWTLNMECHSKIIPDHLRVLTKVAADQAKAPHFQPQMFLRLRLKRFCFYAQTCVIHIIQAWCISAGALVEQST